MAVSAVFIGCVAVLLQLIMTLCLPLVLRLLHTPASAYSLTKDYMGIILWGIFFVFLYNYFSYMLRGMGNSLMPFVFLAVGAACNVALDIYFVAISGWGVKGAAFATVLAQGVSGLGIMAYSLLAEKNFHMPLAYFKSPGLLREVSVHSGAACIQQSIMNFGILMIQGLVNRFGVYVMAAFAIGVKIDAFAYLAVQEYGNAFSVFVAQNHGAGEKERIGQSVKSSIKLIVGFSIVISLLVFFFAPQLIGLFISPGNTEIIAIGAGYLRVEGACYVGIGLLFMLYGYFRAIEMPVMSVILTVVSLGSRVLISYAFASHLGYWVIWCAIPLGWLFADLVGYWVYKRRRINGN